MKIMFGNYTNKMKYKKFKCCNYRHRNECYCYEYDDKNSCFYNTSIIFTSTNGKNKISFYVDEKWLNFKYIEIIYDNNNSSQEHNISVSNNEIYVNFYNKTYVYDSNLNLKYICFGM